MGLFSGLLSLGTSLLGGAGRAVTAAAPAVVRAAPALAAATVGGAAFQAGSNLLTGGTAAAGAAQGAAALAAVTPAIQAGVPALAAAAGAPGRFVVLQDGSRALLSSTGIPIRAQLFLTAGAQIPAGARIVSISPDGLLFGIRRARRRRTFQSELGRCKRVVVTASKLLKALKKGS